MEQYLQLFLVIPLLGFMVSLFFTNKQESYIAINAYLCFGIQLLGILFFTIYWIFQQSPILDLKHFTFYKEENIEIFLDFYFDRYTAVFAILGAFITFLIAIFSKFYLHRDSGYKRFFSTILLFFFGYNVTVFAGNFETLFIGWEFLGITSFLLIAFYRDRYLPVKNALKTISLYRLGDICIILALWTSHHVWHENITFVKLNDVDLVASNISNHYNQVIFLLCMIVVAASIKSAQFPFSSWLPRAMEGPTTSSAVFYGSLAVHLGVFLLLRTYHYWEPILAMKIIIVVIGVMTALIATLIARVQSTVKTQIAYASIAQIGLMFIEVALGWHVLALIHLTGNALLRTYQLLVSPSILGYMIHEQFFNFKPKKHSNPHSVGYKLTNSLYLLSMQEWKMDLLLKKICWDPLKRIGKGFNFLSNKKGLIAMIIIYIAGVIFLVLNKNLSQQIDHYLHLFYGIGGLIMILMAFVEKSNPLKAWWLIILSQSYVILSIALLNDKYEYMEIILYIGGLCIAAIVGTIVLLKIKKREVQIDLNDFYGLIDQYPSLGTWFLIACLAFVGLPFTPSFIGLDLMYSHIDHEAYLLVTITSFSFLVLELSVLRIYARVFLGPNKKQLHPTAFRSS